MKNVGWHERQWRRIEDEYDEAPAEVIHVLHHDMHVPICQIADLLCVSEKTVRVWCHLWGITTRRAGNTKRAVDGKVFLRARALGFDDIGQAIAHYRADGQRWEDIEHILRCASSTISRHIGDAAKGRYNLTAKGRATQRQTMVDLNQRLTETHSRKGFMDRDYNQ